jgi:hypothetical protein
MKRWTKICAYILGIIIVAQSLFLAYYVASLPPEDAENSYQRIIVTDIEKDQTQAGVVTAGIRAEPYLYCPGTESLTFHIGASFYNGSELLGSRTADPGDTSPFEIPRGGRNITIPASNESISPNQVDAIRILAVNRRDQGAPPCDEIAFPEELPPREYWWNSTGTSNATET